jgi:hypothetical protein
MQTTAMFLTNDIGNLRGLVRRRYALGRIIRRAAVTATLITGLAVLLAQIQ